MEQTLAAFEDHIRKNNVDVTQTPFKLGRKPVIDPETELVPDKVVNAFFNASIVKDMNWHAYNTSCVSADGLMFVSQYD